MSPRRRERWTLTAVCAPRTIVGVNLVELLVALVITGLLLGSLAGALDQGQRVYATGSAQVEVTQNTRVALARMAAEIRQAGRGPHPEVFLAIAVAEPSRIVLQQDLNGDGVIGVPPPVAIEAFGSTSLLQFGSNFFLDSILEFTNRLCFINFYVERIFIRIFTHN